MALITGFIVHITHFLLLLLHTKILPKENGAKFLPNLNIKRDFGNFYTSIKPENLTSAYETNPAVHREIVEFYELISGDLKGLGIVDLLWELFESYEGVFYIREGNDYLKLVLTYPFVGIDWVPFLLPGFNSTN